MNETPKRKALKQLVLAVGLLLVCLAGYVVTSRYAPQPRPADSASSTMQEPAATGTAPQPPAGAPQDAGSTATPAGAVSLDGSIVCLPHRNTDGPQTMECAIGFKADAGGYYGLAAKRAEDYKMTTEQPTDTRIRVTGNAVPVEGLSSDEWRKYDVVGVIDVASIEKI